MALQRLQEIAQQQHTDMLRLLAPTTITNIVNIVGIETFNADNAALARICIARDDPNGEGNVVITRNGIRLEDARDVLPLLAEYEEQLTLKPFYVPGGSDFELEQEVTNQDVCDALSDLVEELWARNMNDADVRRFVAVNQEQLATYFDAKGRQLGRKRFDLEFRPNELRCLIADNAIDDVIARIFAEDGTDESNDGED